MSLPRRPEKPLDRDIRKTAKSIRYLGAFDRDPERPGHGHAWVRSDLDPPEWRVRLGDNTFGVGLTPVNGD